jgi:hypothetical protein
MTPFGTHSGNLISHIADKACMHIKVALGLSCLTPCLLRPRSNTRAGQLASDSGSAEQRDFSFFHSFGNIGRADYLCIHSRRPKFDRHVH